ncbi:hypothetical protein [Paenibacillus sp. FSL R7-0331]|uniref:hypothetical protein n=1 Tax=Paenibacillus sp. FSL R7-0331 TaxID=1536773 RepID=UPI000AA47765|nr:hypothetical protein [Paenibacillus sp. FSL R7-0331]
MPNYYFKEIWTPLKWVQIRFFRDDDDRVWVKFGSRRRQLLSRQEAETKTEA